VLLSLVLVAGCSGRIDKAGWPVDPAPVVLRAITPLGGELAGHVFTDQVAELSHHRLTVALQEGWRGTDPSTAEADAIAAVETGVADIGIVPVRAWHQQGVTSFDALIAPMEIETRELNDMVLQSPIAADMLADMRGRSDTGLQPLGLLPGPIVRPIGITRNLTDLQEYRGARIVTPLSAVADRSLHALGAAPIHSYFFGADVSGFDGLAVQVDVVHSNGYDRFVRDIVSNVGLWPRSLLVVANSSVMDALPQSSSDLLAEAVRRAVGPSVIAQSQAEAAAVDTMCGAGRTAFVSAPLGRVAAFRHAFEPVYTWLRADPPTREFLRRIDQLKAEIASGPSEPMRCPRPSDATDSTMASTAAPVSPLDGVWEMVTTAGEMSAYTGDDPGTIRECNFGTFRWTLSRGVYDETQHAGNTETWATGTFTVDGDEFTLRVTDSGGHGPAGDCRLRAGDMFTWRWSIYHDRLTITWPDPDAVDYPKNYEAKPWLRIGDPPAVVSTTH
jgi:TRAP-type C4-dicarboxylate transport system substrate-binding protein